MTEKASTPYTAPSNPLFKSFRGDLVTIVAEAPLPPGSRVEFNIHLTRANKTVLVTGKVVTVSAQSPGAFQLNVRVHSQSRDVRDALIAENVP